MTLTNQRQAEEELRQACFRELANAASKTPEKYQRSLLVYLVTCMLESPGIQLIAVSFRDALEKALELVRKDERAHKVIEIPVSPYQKLR